VSGNDKEIQNISLTRNTVASRADELAKNLRTKHRSIISKFKVFSLAINESTDIRDIAQLAVFIRGCDANLNISEELLEIIFMHDTTTGADIFDALMKTIVNYQLSLKNGM